MRYLKYFYLIIITGILLTSCEKNDNSIIDPILHFPVIDSAYISPTTFDTSNIHITAYCHVSSVDPVQKVTANVYNSSNAQVASITMSGDANNNFNGIINFSMDCRLIGQYRVEFIALTNANLNSNTFPKNFNVINSHNHKPYIISLISPDSLQLPSGVGGDTVRSAFLQLQTNDTDGICDLNQAWFNAFKPDGSPSTGNPFTMYDDGNSLPPHCDTVANDGKFSLLIYLFYGTTPGTYTFKYNVEDKSLSISDTLVHHIYVHQ